MTQTTQSKAGFFARLGSMSADMAERREKRARYNRTIRELNALTSRELVDLGLNRADIRQVALKATFGI